MKHLILLPTLLFFIAACHTPVYFVKNGDYDKAIDVYLENAWREGFKREKFLRALEAAYAGAVQKDLDSLKMLQMQNDAENPVRQNALYRRIQSREQKLLAAGTLKSDKGYVATFRQTPGVDSMEAKSCREAASYLYQRAQNLLAIADSGARPEPAREAYFLLKNLTQNYYPV